MEGGFIKLSRKLLTWEWYSDSNTKDVFLHCLLMANWKDGRFKGYEVPRGSFVTGRKKLSEQLKISEQSIRTALSHLESTNEITIKRHAKFSIITVVKYDEYQSINQQTNQELTINQPSTNHQLTTIEERKKDNNRKKGMGTSTKKSLDAIKAIEAMYLNGGKKNGD